MVRFADIRPLIVERRGRPGHMPAFLRRGTITLGTQHGIQFTAASVAASTLIWPRTGCRGKAKNCASIFA